MRYVSTTIGITFIALQAMQCMGTVESETANLGKQECYVWLVVVVRSTWSAILKAGIRTGLMEEEEDRTDGQHEQGRLVVATGGPMAAPTTIYTMVSTSEICDSVCVCMCVCVSVMLLSRSCDRLCYALRIHCSHVLHPCMSHHWHTRI